MSKTCNMLILVFPKDSMRLIFIAVFFKYCFILAHLVDTYLESVASRFLKERALVRDTENFFKALFLSQQGFFLEI